METPNDSFTPREVSLPPESVALQSRQPEMPTGLLHEEKRLLQRIREVSVLRESTPAARADSVAANTPRSSGRTSSSSSSHADEEEDNEAEEHAIARLAAADSDNENFSEVFYPAEPPAAGGARHCEDAAGRHVLRGPDEAPLSQEHTASQHAEGAPSKQQEGADATDDIDGCSSSSRKAAPTEAKQRTQSEAAVCAGHAPLRHAERDVYPPRSSVNAAPPAAACEPTACSAPFLQSAPLHTDLSAVSRGRVTDASPPLQSTQAGQSLPDTSLTPSTLLPESPSPEAELRAPACDAAEHSVYLQSYSFNQDNTCFLCATTAGFRVFTCAPLFEFMRRESPTWGEGCYEAAGMLFRTNVFALVSAAEQKKVKLWDDQKKAFIGELRSRQPVRNVCLGREILAVVTEYTVYVYQSEQMRPFSIIHTSPNPRGLCIITSTRDRDGWILACPAVAAGAVRVQTSEGDKTSHVFQAHQTPLAVMAFNFRGTWIATASETGTVIRIFCALDGRLLHELRRGTHSYAVTCLALRDDDLFLAVASSSPTVHIFKLEQQEHTEQARGPAHSSEPSNASAAQKTDDPSLSRDPAGLRPGGISTITESLDRLDSASSASTASSTASAAAGGTSATSINSTRTPATPVPLQQALSAGKELTYVVYDASKEIVNDVIKGVFFKYFSAVRSFAQFHVPVDQQAIDVRSPTSRILGPLCAFAGEISNHLYLLHPNGVFYEFRFDPNYGDECTLLTATTWFAPRPDFQIQSHLTLPSLPSELEGGHEGDEWQIVM